MTFRRTAPRFLFGTVTAIAGYLLVAQLSTPSLAQDSDSDSPKLTAVETDMHEYMEYVHQPAYRELRKAMKQEPSEDADWLVIKSNTLILSESGNLIMLRGPANDRKDWLAHAEAIRDVGGQAYRAAHEKNFEQVSQHYRSLLDKCNACHSQFAGGEHMLSP